MPDLSFICLITRISQEEVRNHFGCHSLEGAELEDQGEDGTSLTHWEKRVFEASLSDVLFSGISHVSSISE